MPLPFYIKQIITKKDPRITSLKLNNLGLDDSDAEEIYNLISVNNYIKCVDLSYNNLSADSMTFFAKLSNITKLDISQNNIGDNGVFNYSKNYNKLDSKLKEINLQHNGLTQKCIDSLKELIDCDILIDLSDKPNILKELK